MRNLVDELPAILSLASALDPTQAPASLKSDVISVILIIISIITVIVIITPNIAIMIMKSGKYHLRSLLLTLGRLSL